MSDSKIFKPRGTTLIVAIIAVPVFLFIIFLFYREIRPFSVDDVRSYSWVNGGACDVQYCQGDMVFNEPSCHIKDDGYFYHYDKPVAKLLGGVKRPLIPEFAPRTGGTFEVLNLQTQEICVYDSSS